MDPSTSTNSPRKEFHTTSVTKASSDPDIDNSATDVSSKNNTNIPTILINSVSHDNDITVTPAFPNFPTDEEIVMKPETVLVLEPSNDVSNLENNLNSLPADNSRPSLQSLQLLDELKYLLKPTNSLAKPEGSVQASQEADLAIKRRTLHLDEDLSNNAERLLIEDLTPNEMKSLGAAERRSTAARSQPFLNILSKSDRSRATSMQSSARTPSYSQPATIIIAQPEHRTIVDHLSGLIWAFLAAYAFTIILFLTKTLGIDLIFGFFLQMMVQTVAFGVYAFYKGYNLLGPSEHRIAMICRALLIGIGVLTSFLAYYYITLPELSAVRQSQVILTIILSIFLLQERVTVSRIIACVLTIIAIIVLIRPTTIRSSYYTKFNLTDSKTSWVPYASSWNYIIGISFALCTAITYSIASIMNKIYFNTQHLHNTVLCFWSALSALIISIILVYVTHFVIKDARSFPHDWRLFVGIALALASIFVFIANQKAIKRERSSIVTLIYSTDIILALILQNLLTDLKSDGIIVLGCVLILVSILIICIEVLIIEKHQSTLSIKVSGIENTNGDDKNLQRPSISKTTPKRLSI